MEDEKLAEYYDDLTRRGGGAARFKQGLGFSADADAAKDYVPPRGSALPGTSSFLNSFVRASSPAKTSEFEKQAKLQSIQNKLSKKPKEKSLSRRSRSRDRSRDRDIDKHGKRRSRSRERNSRRRSRSVGRRSRRSRSREVEPRGRYRPRSRSRDKNRESRRHSSPEERRSQKKLGVTSGGGSIDFAKSIEGYDSMTPAERVKAKMKLQLSKTAENDEMIGKGSGWERFDFDKDAPLDNDEEIEAAEDDAVVVKHMGQSFRFSALEAKREEQIKSAHDEAIFGGPSFPRPAETEDESGNDTNRDETAEEAPVSSLLSDQILTMQGGSWRDRARKT